VLSRPIPLRRILPLLLPLLAGLAFVGVFYFGDLHVWGDAGERLRLITDTTMFAEEPLFVGAIPVRDSLSPYALEFEKGLLYVTYAGENIVDIYNAEFALLRTLDLHYQDGGLISGVAVKNERIYIADMGRAEMRMHDSSGVMRQAFGWLPGGTEKLVPHGITAKGGIVYVTDVAHGQVHAIVMENVPGRTETGELLFSGPLGSGNVPTLSFPSFAAITPDGRILVSDLAGGRVDVLTCDGFYAYSMGNDIVHPMRAPNAIAFDNLPDPELLALAEHEFDPSGIQQQGRIHIVDRERHEVYVFNPKGKFILSYGADELEIPNGIAIDQARRLIIVADAQKRALVLYRY
jgi:6-bladed beta-propeller protein